MSIYSKKCISPVSVLIFFMLGAACKLYSSSEFEKAQPLKNESSETKERYYDSRKYNLTCHPDTMGCWLWITPTDKYDDSLINEQVLVKRNGSYKVLFQSRDSQYLWPCNLPEFIQVEDTIIVSANVYGIQKNEAMPGQPTLIKSIHYQFK